MQLRMTFASGGRKMFEMWFTKCNKWSFIKTKVKVKVSRNKSGVVQRVPGGIGSQIS